MSGRETRQEFKPGERLPRPRCPKCAMDLEPKKEKKRGQGIADLEDVFFCSFCNRDWLEDSDCVWYADGNPTDWKKNEEG